MELSRELKAALGSADQLLADRAAIFDAITLAESLLPAAIAHRLHAESALSEAEASAALNQGDSTLERKAVQARKHLADCRAELDSIAARLTGLRSRLASHGSEITSTKDAIALLSADFSADVAEGFIPEWSTACGIFGRTLAKRLAIEAAIGERLDLLDPTPSDAPVDLGEIARPMVTLQALETALGQIQSMQAQQERQRRIPPAITDDSVLEFLQDVTIDSHQWTAGNRTLAKVLTPTALKYLTTRRLVRRIDSLATV